MTPERMTAIIIVVFTLYAFHTVAFGLKARGMRLPPHPPIFRLIPIWFIRQLIILIREARSILFTNSLMLTGNLDSSLIAAGSYPILADIGDVGTDGCRQDRLDR